MTLDTAFCMDNGQVKTGDGASDTWVKMLQEVNRITAPIAYGIAAEYPSASALVEAFDEKGADTSEAKDLLTHLKKSANKDGAFTDREIGKRISRRVWGIFMGMDEESTDV
jgi:crossover junction endonuclease EME1